MNEEKFTYPLHFQHLYMLKKQKLNITYIITTHKLTNSNKTINNSMLYSPKNLKESNHV